MSPLNWWERSAPRPSYEPWLHPDVTAYLKELLDPWYEVLEHGSGGSTLWFAGLVSKVVSIETDSSWYRAVKETAPDNVRLILWGRGNYPRIKKGGYDLFLIDGEPVADRSRFLRDAERFIKPGGYLVLDNANRPEYAEERLDLLSRAELLESFDRNTPTRTRYLVTEFYRMGGDA